MLRPTATNVIPEANYKLRIEFDNGEIKRLDVTPFIKGDWYGRLSDVNYFNAVKADGFTLVWPDGQDLCPDDVYGLSEKI